ncbi:MAG: hypothetical protein L6R38_008382 [Xanthoria sp. 2 TBL-2021]|nr:MAG: hypothetical protein L6R38_008382 [Xanthoria sp. 2 TBL-2021]
MGDGEDGGTATIWLLLLDLLLDLSVLKAKLEPNTLEAEVLVVEELDCRDVGLVRTTDISKLFELFVIWGPVLELLGKERLDEIETLKLDSDAELLYKLVLELGEETTLAIVRVVLLVEEPIERPDGVMELAEDRAELELVVLKARVLDDSLVRLGTKLDNAEPEVELDNTLDRFVSILDPAELKVALEDTAADVDDVEAEADVDVGPKRLEDAADVVEFASDEDTLDPVVRLARRLDAEADDELGAAVDTPTLSALIMSAAYPKC